MQEIIENALLEGIRLNENFHIPIEEVNSEISDTVLICSFELYLLEDYEAFVVDPEQIVTDEYMEELKLGR